MVKLVPIHPFPARMAPEIALDQCSSLAGESVVLDPMCGSGTTMRTAIELGLRGVGVDSDPLAVLMSKVYTTPVDAASLYSFAESLVGQAKLLNPAEITLDWIDEDKETQDFISFWFARTQIRQLRTLSYLLHRYSGPQADALRIALSRIIITKEQTASLARDTSHSRPHRVAVENDYDVYAGFLKSTKHIASKLPTVSLAPTVKIRQGDARDLTGLKNGTVDAIITSPPYLNQIDYMRGHKMSLVWFGHRLSELRVIRSTNVGAERRVVDLNNEGIIRRLMDEMPFTKDLPSSTRGIFERYIADLIVIMEEMSRVLKSGGKMVMVVGNSCIKGIFVENTQAVRLAAEVSGIQYKTSTIRELPPNRRYLPPPQAEKKSSLEGRMRTESVMIFARA